MSTTPTTDHTPGGHEEKIAKRLRESITDHEDGFETPPIDWDEAARFQPSKLKGNSLTYMVAFVAGTGFTLFGYDQGVMSGMLTLPIFLKQFPSTATEAGFGGGNANAATLQSFMVAIYEIGCLVGALSNLWVGDKLGRKHTIALGGFIMTIGAILQTTAFTYAHMLVARVVTGIGNGLLTSTVPAYQSECAKPHRRGQLVLWMGSLITFGIMISYWINLGCYFIDNDAAWRFPMAFQIVFAIIMIGCIYGFRLPDSPRWLVSKGRYAEAVAVLAALDNTTVDDPEIRRTFHGIVDSAQQESKEKFSVRELMSHGKTQHFRRTLLGFLAQMFQQISGINLITYYLTTVLGGMGLGPVMSRTIAGVNGTVYFLTSIAALFMVERFGRRPLMVWTALLQAATFAILAGLYKEVSDGNKAAQGVSVLMLFLFNTWFSIGWLGMTWLYPAEVTPLRIRAPANAVSTASNWLFNFMVVMATGPMFAKIGWGTYAFFAAMNGIIIFPVVYLYFPETKKYSLEELDIIFAKAHNERRNPVTVSLEGDIPPAGSREAEQILGRTIRAEKMEDGGFGRRLSRVISGPAEGRRLSREHV
ncbi:hypothetical protein CcaverHIS002_0207680 [Cutaneotrichosporon cavernicola]|uniref:Major facilitator superfamily (MFS) profile domain-containing protein n=1 Tax=Cutaneotrichosporon cavernicola TaxID=279322 RepID=A0AA48L1C6_9TREE|nr:uncharacterized protein CcaverHIS019_0207670 [Cutaneotrichosporon cavernicola]BEI81608.1 hypothetical protein CcaverHIS002_0207680 [Cutaneotrichosporon cavernicola]BEI89405.1 hypothetical protein CcaverHIS019_0207670 [Cutaneotrichosporon cavernicola]BEI97179.1 hypothetical protein CcaverHIS631_0207680 [Cutaneotrichosporon cavernicola]BEJ04952.1 hypothetical protein CcaverHIS641_0207690 [Cutaneotrichosporon cavernicola]